MIRSTAVLVLVLFLLSFGTVAFAQDMKIGVVDLMRALNESNAGKKAKSELEGMIKGKQVAIDEKGKAIEKMKADLEKQASVLSADARKAKQEDLEKMVTDYQRMVSDAQNELKKKEGEFTGGILNGLRDVIEKMGQAEGYTMIVENAEGIILYSQKNLDLTTKVIEKYNELNPGKE